MINLLIKLNCQQTSVPNAYDRPSVLSTIKEQKKKQKKKRERERMEETESKSYSRVMGVRGTSLVDVRGGWQALHDGSRGIPSWRRILGCRYSVMVTLAHLGQIPPMGIHILTLLRFSLAYHPFHTRCDTSPLFGPPGLLLWYTVYDRFTSPSRRFTIGSEQREPQRNAPRVIVVRSTCRNVQHRTRVFAIFDPTSREQIDDESSLVSSLLAPEHW